MKLNIYIFFRISLQVRQSAETPAVDWKGNLDITLRTGWCRGWSPMVQGWSSNHAW